jgi:hypothetical protein
MDERPSARLAQRGWNAYSRVDAVEASSRRTSPRL